MVYVSHIEVLCDGSVLLFLDAKRYLIGLPEGAQRSALQSKNRLSKFVLYVLPSVTWDIAGGLPGAMLTSAAAGSLPPKLIGPPGLVKMLLSSKTFLTRGKNCICAAEYPAFGDLDAPQPTYTDGTVVIYPVPLARSGMDTTAYAGKMKALRENPHTEMRYLNSVYTNDLDSPVQQKPKMDAAWNDYSSMEIATNRPELGPGAENDGSVLCSVFRLPDSPGKFDAKRAKELGVPPGPLCGRLVKGETVVLPNGTEVRPEQCCGQTVLGLFFIYVHCPSSEYLDSLVSSVFMQKFFADGEYGKRLTYIVHNTARTVCESAAYREWVAKFGPHVRNILVHRDFRPNYFVNMSAVEFRTKLSFVDPKMFLEPRFFEEDTFSRPEYLSALFPSHPNTTIGSNGQKFQITTTAKASNGKPEKFDPVPSRAEIEATVRENTEVWNAIETYRAMDKGEPVIKKEGGPVVTFFGTGAGFPSKYRNVAGVLMQYAKGKKCCLVDCGESTFGQMCTAFGRSRVLEMISRELEFIAVSHHHADHRLGIFSFIEKRAEMRAQLETVLTVFAPGGIIPWITEHMKAICKPDLLALSKTILAPIDGLETKRPHDEFVSLDIESVPVVHCYDAHGFIFTTTDDWKVAYSGDCRPSAEFGQKGLGADLLIHEATLGNEHGQEAEMKRHSTVNEGKTVANMMGAKVLVLTHFSQRYPKEAPFEDILSRDPVATDAVMVPAFDLLRLDLSDVHRSEPLLRTLSMLVAAEEQEEVDEDLI